MNTPSDEQQLVIDNLKFGYNVICSAVAGSGKSSTVLSTAKQLPERNILQITYNSSLRLEIKEKVTVLGLTNIKIHTFHSLAVKYYAEDCHTDTGLRRLLFNNTKPRSEITPFDLLMLDEFQDCSELYFKFIVKFIRDMSQPVQLLILGDPLQCLYEFKGADPRFLTMAQQIWRDFELLKSNVFVDCPLRMSYRITNHMASFVNNAMFGNNLMLSCKSGEPVTYIRNSRYNIEKTVVYTIKELLNGGVKPNEIFILAASVKGVNSHVRKMENALVEQNIPCHVPMFESDKLDDRVIDGKIVFSTFHCAKGRQRKYVFIVGFDNNYFNQFARTITDKMECPNTLYVGCTRATNGLYLLEFDQYPTDRPLEFLKMGHHDFIKSDFVKFKGMPRSIFYPDDSGAKAKSLIDKKYETPTKLIKFIPDSTLDYISPIIDKLFTVGSPISNTIDIPMIIQTKCGFFESVSDLNGIAIPSLYYDHLNQENQQNILHKMVENTLVEMKENEHAYLKRIVKELPEKCGSIRDYLLLANVYTAIQERLYFKLKQIGTDEYNWITDKIINDCIDRLDSIIGIEMTGENPLVISECTIIHHSMEDLHTKIDQTLAPFFPENMRFRFSAIVDLITESSVWELKCTSEISMDHKLQVIVYAWIWTMLDKPVKDFKILNIKTGEIVLMNYEPTELTNIVVALLKGKYEDIIPKSDEVFLCDVTTVCKQYKDCSKT
jgi:hypothetical protein